MKGNLKVVAPRSEMTWSMPVHAENYDRSPLTEEECWALAQRTVRGREHHSSNESRTARRLLARFSQPIEDVFWLRHSGQGQGVMVIRRKVRLILHREMYQRGKMFWEWSPDEWLETICPNSMLFHEKYGSMPGCRMSIMDMAYLFGGVTDLRLLGMRKEMTETAWAYFGRNLVNEQCERVYNALQKKDSLCQGFLEPI